MNQGEAEKILLRIKELYGNHVANFSVNAYLDDLEEIDRLFQLLYTIDTESFPDSYSWKSQCTQVLQLHDKLKALAGKKMLEMNRAKNLNYTSLNKVEAFYIDRKG